MKKTPGKTVAAREKYWTRKIEEARRHPGGVTDYCRQNELSKENYYQWFRRLRVKHPDWEDLTNHPEIDAKTSGTEIVKEEADSVEAEVLVKPRRKKFKAEDRALILEQTDNAMPDELAAILRREGIHVHTLNKWRTQRDLMAMATRKRGPKVAHHAAENKLLRDKNARLEKKLHRATEIIKLQKKISEILGVTLEELEEPW